MKKTVLMILMVIAVMALLSAPRLYNRNGMRTPYFHYHQKYHDIWDLADSSKVLMDTIYIYRLGGRQFAFNQNGDLLENYHEKVW